MTHPFLFLVPPAGQVLGGQLDGVHPHQVVRVDRSLKHFEQQLLWGQRGVAVLG